MHLFIVPYVCVTTTYLNASVINQIISYRNLLENCCFKRYEDIKLWKPLTDTLKKIWYARMYSAFTWYWIFMYNIIKFMQTYFSLMTNSSVSFPLLSGKQHILYQTLFYNCTSICNFYFFIFDICIFLFTYVSLWTEKWILIYVLQYVTN